MSSISDGGKMKTALDNMTATTAMGQAALDSARAYLSSLPADPKAAQAEINKLLQVAGLEIRDGKLTIKDTVAVNKAAAVKEAAVTEQLYGPGQGQLKVPTPPRIAMTPELRVGAETFAANLNLAMNDIYAPGRTASGQPLLGASSDAGQAFRQMAPEQMLTAFMKLNINDPNNSPETHDKLYDMMSSLRQVAIKQSQDKLAEAITKMKDAENYAKATETLGWIINAVMIVVSVAVIVASLGTATPLVAAGAAAVVAGTAAATTAVTAAATAAATTAATTAASSAATAAATTAATQVATTAASQVATEAAVQAGQQAAQAAVREIVRQIGKEGLRKMGEQQFQALLRQMSQEVGNQMAQSVGKQLTKEALGQVNKQAMKEVSDLMAKEFSKQVMAEMQTQVGRQITQQVADKCLTTAFSRSFSHSLGLIAKFGATGVQMSKLGMWLGRMTNPAPQLKMLGIGTSAAAQLVNGTAQVSSANKSLDAQETQVHAKRMDLIARMAQGQLEEENEIMNMCMESKNQTCDAVIRMLNAMFATNQKIMSAGMAR